ncbi:MAG: class I SAM-dependent methyltransferase [Candidatus Freyarchaeota archaeon]
MSTRWSEAQKFEKKFWRKFFGSDYYPSLDRFSIAREWRFLLPTSLEYKKKIVLEVGSALTGPIHRFMENTYKIGVDPLMGTFFKPTRNNISYIRAVGENLPFVDEKIDFVLSWNVLDHMYNPEKSMEEMYRILKREGKLLLLVHTFPLIIMFFKPIVDKLDLEHPFHFHYKEIVKMITNKGFTITRLASTKIVKEALKLLRLKLLLASFFLKVLFIKAEKPNYRKNKRGK